MRNVSTNFLRQIKSYLSVQNENKTDLNEKVLIYIKGYSKRVFA